MAERIVYNDILRKYVEMVRQPPDERFLPHEKVYLERMLRRDTIREWAPLYKGTQKPTIPFRIRKFLATHRDMVFTAAEIREALDITNFYSCHGALMRLKNAGLIRKVAHNQWSSL